MKKVLIILASVFALTGCSKASRVNWNIREDANNFKITRKVVALNTRTNDPLFTVEGTISPDSDEDGDLNVTIKTGKGKYKLFYAHLSNDVTYTCIQTKAKKENPNPTPKEKKEISDEEKEMKSKRKQIQEKLIKFATRIPVFMYFNTLSQLFQAFSVIKDPSYTYRISFSYYSHIQQVRHSCCSSHGKARLSLLYRNLFFPVR